MLERANRPIVFFKASEQRLKLFGILAWNHDLFGLKAVFQCVHPGDLLTCSGFRS
jgi:hypothetical protein